MYSHWPFSGFRPHSHCKISTQCRKFVDHNGFQCMIINVRIRFHDSTGGKPSSGYGGKSRWVPFSFRKTHKWFHDDYLRSLFEWQQSNWCFYFQNAWCSDIDVDTCDTFQIDNLCTGTPITLFLSAEQLMRWTRKNFFQFSQIFFETQRFKSPCEWHDSKLQEKIQ